MLLTLSMALTNRSWLTIVMENDNRFSFKSKSHLPHFKHYIEMLRISKYRQFSSKYSYIPSDDVMK